MLPVEIAGVFATEPDCQGLKLRGLTETERGIPGNQLPLLFDLYYEGKPHTDFYNGTGRGEDEGWMFTFNGPKGHFSANVKTEQDAVRRVCLATKGKGAAIDGSGGKELGLGGTYAVSATTKLYAQHDFVMTPPWIICT